MKRIGFIVIITMAIALQAPECVGQDLTEIDLASLVADLHSRDPLKREQAIAQLRREIGRVELETWFCAITEERLEYSRKLASVKQSIFRLVLSSDEGVSQTAISLTRLLGTEAKLAMPHLRQIVLDRERSLGARREAIHAMYFVSGENEAVTSLLIPVADDLASLLGGGGGVDGENNEEGRRTSRTASIALAATALSQTLLYSGHTSTELNTMMHIIKQSDSDDTRLLLLMVLSTIGAEATSVVDELWFVLKDDSKLIQMATATAILEITHDRAAVPSIAKQMGLTKAEFDAFVIQAESGLDEDEKTTLREIEEIRISATFMIPALVGQALNAPGPVARNAIRTLGKVGVEAQPAIIALEHCVASRRGETRRMARESLRSIRGAILTTKLEMHRN